MDSGVGPRRSLGSLSDAADSVLTRVPPHLITINFQSHYISCSQMRRFSGERKPQQRLTLRPPGARSRTRPSLLHAVHGNRTESCGKHSAVRLAELRGERFPLQKRSLKCCTNVALFCFIIENKTVTSMILDKQMLLKHLIAEAV